MHNYRGAGSRLPALLCREATEDPQDRKVARYLARRVTADPTFTGEGPFTEALLPFAPAARATRRSLRVSSGRPSGFWPRLTSKTLALGPHWVRCELLDYTCPVNYACPATTCRNDETCASASPSPSSFWRSAFVTLRVVSKASGAAAGESTTTRASRRARSDTPR